MKLNTLWNSQKEPDQIDIISHPVNKEKITAWTKTWLQPPTLKAIQPANQRTVLVDLMEIEAIEALGHMSKIRLLTGEELWLSQKLKELAYLEDFDFFRINNSTILNINQIAAFASGQHARLEVFTKNQQTYLVSRHYAKQIKEHLS